MNRRVAGLVVGVLAVVVLAGCGANGSGTSEDSGFAGSAQGNKSLQGANPAPEKPAAGQPAEAKPEAKTAADTAAQNRQMIRTASVDLEGKDIAALLIRVKDLAVREGGFVGQENSTLSGGTVTLRVPSDRLDTVLKGLGELEDAKVVRRESHTEDVTEQIVDVESRITTQRASVDRVRALLERATSTSEITTIESELTKRQSELESLQRRYDTLKGQSSLSTVTISVRQAGAPPAPPADEAGFFSALSAGWDALLVALRWLLVILGGALPFLLFIGVPLAAALYFRRKRAPIKPAPSKSTN